MSEFNRHKSEESDMRGLGLGISKLNLKIGSESPSSSYDSSIISYIGWTAPPRAVLASPDVSLADVVRCLSSECYIGIPHQLLPKLKNNSDLPIGGVTVQSDERSVAAEAKPNLLVAVATLLISCNIAQQQKTEIEKEKSITATATTTTASVENNPIDQLIQSAFRGIDIISPRNPIKKFMSCLRSGEQFVMYASQPLVEAPLFIERAESYSANEGSIGMLFEAALTEPSPSFRRVYAVSEAVLRGKRDEKDMDIGLGLGLVLTCEIDCVDGSGEPVEVKSRPGWKPADANRELDAWTQSKLCGVKSIITGSFQSIGRARGGPVNFPKNSIKQVSTEQYGDAINPRDKETELVKLHQALDHIRRSCVEIGVVYQITSSIGSDSLCEVRACRDATEFIFPISAATIKVIAEAALIFRRKKAAESGGGGGKAAESGGGGEGGGEIGGGGEGGGEIGGGGGEKKGK